MLQLNSIFRSTTMHLSRFKTKKVWQWNKYFSNNTNFYMKRIAAFDAVFLAKFYRILKSRLLVQYYSYLVKSWKNFLYLYTNNDFKTIRFTDLKIQSDLNVTEFLQVPQNACQSVDSFMKYYVTKFHSHTDTYLYAAWESHQ